jgi:hypothetical protein
MLCDKCEKGEARRYSAKQGGWLCVPCWNEMYVEPEEDDEIDA